MMLDREVLHERVYALKFALEQGGVDLGDAQHEILKDLMEVKTEKDGMVDPNSVSPRLMTLIQATLDQPLH